MNLVTNKRDNIFDNNQIGQNMFWSQLILSIEWGSKRGRESIGSTHYRN